jgi:hypothetical protein
LPRPGPVPSVPRRLRSYWALRLLAFFGRRSGRPSLRGPPRVGRFFCAGRRCTLYLRRVGDSVQAPRSACVARGRARPPRSLGRPLETCRGRRPRRAPRRLAPCRRRRCCLQGTRTLGRSETSCFGAVLTRPASSRAYASSGGIAAPEARLATGLPGWALAGRVSHPLDDYSKFRESPHDSVLSDRPCLVAPCSCSCSWSV